MVTPKQLGHLVIRVRDLDRSEQFYTDVLGLHVTNKRQGKMVFLSAGGDASHELALMPVGADAPGPESSRVGLYHFAWEMQSFDDLKRLYRHMQAQKVNIGGIGDHGISIGVHFFDPDGNEIEVFYEMPKSEWPADSDLFSGKFPQSLEGDQVVEAAAGRS